MNEHVNKDVAQLVNKDTVKQVNPVVNPVTQEAKSKDYNPAKPHAKLNVTDVEKRVWDGKELSKETPKAN